MQSRLSVTRFDLKANGGCAEKAFGRSRFAKSTRSIKRKGSNTSSRSHPTIARPHVRTHTTLNPHNHRKIHSGSTHARELDATVTALGGSALLLQVKVPELAARSLDDANLVGPRVVPIEAEPSICRPKDHLPIHCNRLILVQHRSRRRSGIAGG